MARKKRDDLFENSQMTFLEHLDELRYRLIQAIYWLAAGFVLALIPFGSHGSLTSRAVSCIQRPLTQALERYYTEHSARKLSGEMDQLRQLGYSQSVAQIPERLGMAEREVWLFPDDIARLRRILDGEDAAAAPERPALLTNARALEQIDNSGSFGALPRGGADAAEPIPFFFWEKLAIDPRIRAKSLSMPETFVIFLKAALVLGAFIGSPGLFYHFWAFVGAGLYPKERRLVYRFFPFSLFLFFAGAALAFFVVFQFVLHYLLTFNSGLNVDPDPRISEWLKLAIGLPIGFGLGFQLPLVMFALYRLRIFTTKDYMSQWRISVLVIAFGAMMLTPPDPGSMFCMMVPLISLYFLGIGLCKLWPLPKSEFDEADEED
ncbi:MAG: twin-arginine translocase subunit TatC [Thermoguttaceae bacterium]|nr:twin-arginine translocase subunit TatC [Thermoguttaceae bacterium]